jgi:hypothetical protein
MAFICVTGNAGFRGNERVDRLADCPVIEGVQPMELVDIVNDPREISMEEQFVNRESASLLRMKEIEKTIGTSKNQTFPGRQRRHINKHRAGTIRHSTLMNMPMGDLIN